jgi:hypothetical protein
VYDPGPLVVYTRDSAIVDIGENAGVKVDQKLVKNKVTGQAEVKPLYASAHDLRRAFGDVGPESSRR